MNSQVRFVATGLLVAFALLGITLVALALPQETGTSIGITASGESICPALGRTLSRSSKGADVTMLQRYLSQDPGVYPEAQVSGFYGELTQAAVKRFQIKFNIVSPNGMGSSDFGVVGPRTIAAIKEQCSSVPGVAASAAPAVGGFMSISPISGGAPLTVSIQAIVNTANVCGGAVYNVDYGDGSIQSQIAVPARNCQQVMKLLSHTYRNPGNYKVTLSVGQHSAFATVAVAAGGATPIVGPRTTASAAQSGDAIRATPTMGSSPLSVIFTGLINSQQSCAGGTYTIVFGDGNTAGLSFDSTTCSARTFSIAHEFSSAGKYTAELHVGGRTGMIAGTADVTAY